MYRNIVHFMSHKTDIYIYINSRRVKSLVKLKNKKLVLAGGSPGLECPQSDGPGITRWSIVCSSRSRHRKMKSPVAAAGMGITERIILYTAAGLYCIWRLIISQGPRRGSRPFDQRWRSLSTPNGLAILPPRRSNRRPRKRVRLMKSFVFGAADALWKFAPSGRRHPKGISIPTATAT